MSTSSSPAVQIVVMGVSATGKTTVAERLSAELGFGFVEGDDYHPQANIDKMSAGEPLDDADRRPWLDALAALLAEREAAGESTILTCSALKRSYRDLLRAGVADVYFIHLHADFDVLLPRMSSRTKHFMPTSMLRSQFDTLEALGPDESGRVVDVAPPVEDVVADALAAVRAHDGR